jgi:citrate lyase beta subunit
MKSNTVNSFQSWLFTGGHDIPAAIALLKSRPAVLVVDLEEFTPPDRKDEACLNFKQIVAAAADSGVACAIRLDQLHEGGDRQLAAIAAARPCAILLPQIDQPQQLRDLWQLMMLHELEGTGLIPTIESRSGLFNLEEILTSTEQITAVLIGTGDLSTDLGLGKNSDRMTILQQSRESFASLCRKHNVDPIDGPWPELMDPLQRPDDYLQDCEFSRAAGFSSRCALTSGQAIHWQL